MCGTAAVFYSKQISGSGDVEECKVLASGAGRKRKMVISDASQGTASCRPEEVAVELGLALDPIERWRIELGDIEGLVLYCREKRFWQELQTIPSYGYLG